MTPAHTKPSLPSKDDLLAFIGRQSGKIGTREIARASKEPPRKSGDQ